MARNNMKTANTGLNLGIGGVQIVNAIRNELGADFSDRIPATTQATIKEFGNSLKAYPDGFNKFFSTLVNKIGLTVIKNKMYSNPLKEFQRGDLPIGMSVEEIFIDVVKAKGYQGEPASDNLGDVFAINKPDVKVRYHSVDSQLVYPISVSRQQAMQAFNNVASFEDFVSKLFESVYASAELDEFLQTKALINTYRTAPEEGGSVATNRFYDVEITEVTDEASAKAFARVLRKLSSDITFMKTKYNYAGVTTHTPREDQVLMINTDSDSYLDVDVLAYAFNMSKADPADVVGKKVVLDDFGGDDTDDTLAILVDRDWFMIYTQLFENQEQNNALHLYYNSFLHVWKLYSVSQFANAIRFKKKAVVEATPETPAE